MARIPENILNEIQDRCDIVEVISNYIPLKPAGRNFKASCPFHHEKTPSFIVSPDKQIYHCFGCNSGGNVFNFIKDYEKIDFLDAVKVLAKKAGVKLPEYKKENDRDESLVNSIYKINEIAVNYYSSLLEKSHKSSEPLAYLEKRGIGEAFIKKFSIGYASADWRGFCDYITKRGIEPELALKAGLILKGKDGSFYDLFRNRLIFPIQDVHSKIIGFGARILDESLPKYINSPETVVYKKGQNLYGLDLARLHIREKGFAIITEGYIDVITSHQHGISNVIASLGTALTVEQIRLLKRYTHNVVMVYDADQAGEIASLRGLDLFLQEGINVKVSTLAKGHDPDSYIRKFGPEKFSDIIKIAKNLFAYKLDFLRDKFGVGAPEQKAEIVKEMLSTISLVRNAVLKAEYIKELSQDLSIKEEALWEELKAMKNPHTRREEVEDINAKRKSIDISPAEKILTRLMMEDAAVVKIVRDNLKPFDFKNPDVRHLAEALFCIDLEQGAIDPSRLINYLEDKVSPHVISFIVNEDINIEDRDKNVSDCIKVIKKEQRTQRLKYIQERLHIAQKEGQEKEAKNLLEEFNSLIKEGV